MNSSVVVEPTWREMTFSRLLQDMNEAGQFKASFLVDSQGLPVAAVTSEHDTDTTSAVVALVKNTIEQVQSLINLAESDEVTIRGKDNMRLVSRYFNIENETLILVVVAPPERPYRKLTNQTIKALKSSWSS